MVRIKYIGMIGVILSVLILSGCGFHLRGAVSLPPTLHNIYVKSEAPSSPLLPYVRERLTYSGVHTVDVSDQASLVLVIVDERVSTQATSIGTSNSIRSYQVNYAIRYEIRGKKNQRIAGPYIISSEQDVTVLQDEVLENSNKLQQAKTQLMHDSVTKMLFQLSSSDLKQAIQTANA